MAIAQIGQENLEIEYNYRLASKEQKIRRERQQQLFELGMKWIDLEMKKLDVTCNCQCNHQCNHQCNRRHWDEPDGDGDGDNSRSLALMPPKCR